MSLRFSRIPLVLASSSGLGTGNPLVLCNQACILEYAVGSNDSRFDRKIDWICDHVVCVWSQLFSAIL